MPTQPLKPGDPVTLSRFELLGRLGEGGQGVVFLGRGTEPGEERVAIKVLRAGVDPLTLERLARELDAIHQVQPFVTAGVIEAAAEGDRRFIVSEFIDGPSLQDRVDARGPLTVGELHRLAVGTASALAAIHGAGVVHRDFKPANVLLGPDGPRVVDFGIARLHDASTITSGVIGTPSYMSPEQLSGVRPTSAVDIFAWAVTMVFAATGRPAFNADTIPAVMHRILFEEPEVSGVPAALLPVIRECLNKEPAGRPGARDLMVRLVDPSAARYPAGLAAGSPGAVPSTPAMTSDPGQPSYPPADLAGSSQPGLTQPGSDQPGLLPPKTKVAGRSRRGLALIGAGVAVAAALVAGVILLLPHDSSAPQASGPAGPGRTSSPAATTSSSSPPATTASRPPPASGSGPTIPAAFAGTWGGTAAMSPISDPGFKQKSDITFTFTPGARTVHEVNDDCVNTLTLSKVTGRELTFSEPQTSACVAGTVTFSRHGARLAYRWFNDLVQNAGLLARS
jgi:serine/threonine protein kinase